MLFLLLNLNRIINWRIWLSCSKVSSLTRTPVIKSKHKFFSGKKIWSVYIASNSVCAATWHLYRVANCQIPRYVEFIFLFRVFCHPTPTCTYIYGDIVLYNNSSAAFTLKLDILFLFPLPFLLRFIYLPFLSRVQGFSSKMCVSVGLKIVGGKIENVTSSNGWDSKVCVFNIHCACSSSDTRSRERHLERNQEKNCTVKNLGGWFMIFEYYNLRCRFSCVYMYYLLLLVKIGHFHWRKHFSTHAPSS